jgi:hypothetical protein
MQLIGFLEQSNIGIRRTADAFKSSWDQEAGILHCADTTSKWPRVKNQSDLHVTHFQKLIRLKRVQGLRPDSLPPSRVSARLLVYLTSLCITKRNSTTIRHSEQIVKMTYIWHGMDTVKVSLNYCVAQLR